MTPIDPEVDPRGSSIQAKEPGGLRRAARTKGKVAPKYETKYRVKSWPTYEASLRRRGDITIWFDEDAISAWNAPVSGLPGGQRSSPTSPSRPR